VAKIEISAKIAMLAKTCNFAEIAATFSHIRPVYRGIKFSTLNTVPVVTPANRYVYDV